MAQGGKGKISGQVLDNATGEPLMGVNVRLEAAKLGATTDNNGYYVILNVQPGKHKLTASMIGYGTITQTNVEVFIDRTTKIDFRMKDVSAQLQAVTIVAEKPKIIKDQTSSASTLDDEQLKAAPIEGLRGALDLSSGFQKNAQGDYQVRGSGTNEVSFQVNGVEQSNSSTAVPGWGNGTKADNSWKYDVNPLGVQQMQLITGGFASEYGNAQAAVVKVVLKEGSPKFTGEMRVEYRPAGQYHWSDYIYNKSNIAWRTWGDLSYWQSRASDQAVQASPGNNILVQLGFNSRYKDLYNKVSTKGAVLTASERATWDSLVSSEINWAYNKWVALHTPSDDNLLGVYDYRKLSYYRASFGFGGPIGKNPDLLRFFLSGEYLNKPTRLPSTEKTQVRQNYTLTLTSSAVRDHKFKFIGSFQQYVGGLFSGSDDIRWSGIPTNGVYHVNRNPVRTEQTVSQSFNWIYTINSKSFLESTISHQFEKYELPYRYLDTWNDENDRADSLGDRTGSLLTRGDWWMTSLYDGFENIATDFFQDNRAESFSLKSDYSNQFNKDNLFKVGLQLSYRDMSNTGVTYNFKANSYVTQQGVAEHYTAYPISGSLYIQDKIEYEGMVANFGLRCEAYNFQSNAPADVFNIFYPGTQGPGNTGSTAKVKSKTKSVVQPRLGISFPIGESTAFRMQYGHFASMPIYSQALGNSTFYGWNTMGNPNLDPKITINYEFGIQQLLDQENRLDVAIFYNDRVTQIGTVQVAGYTGNAQHNVGFTSTNEPLYYYNHYANNTFGSTIGLEVTLEKNVVNEISYRLSYTISQTTDGVYGSPILYPQDASSYQTRINSLETLSSSDRTHNFRGLIQYNVSEEEGPELFNIKPFSNATFALTYTAQSGQPYTYRTRNDLKDVVYNRRYPIETSFDFNCSKRIQFESSYITIAIRVMNVFNNKWLTPPDTNEDFLKWINNGVTIDQADDPNKQSYLLYAYRAYRNIPRQIFFTVGVGI